MVVNSGKVLQLPDIAGSATILIPHRYAVTLATGQGLLDIENNVAFQMDADASSMTIAPTHGGNLKPALVVYKA